MQLEIWNLGRGDAQRWAPSLSRNMTVMSAGHRAFAPHIRLTGDIGNYWSGNIGNTESLMATVDQIQGIDDLWSYGMGNTSGTFPNYGQMIVGVPKDHPTAGDTGLTLTEAQSHFSMWCMFPTILMATNDVRLRDAHIERILLNKEAIAINQDPWTIPAVRIAPPVGCGGAQWMRPLANGDIAVLVLNRNNGPESVYTRLDFAALVGGNSDTGSRADAATSQYTVRDVQEEADLGVACGHVDLTLAPHQSAFLRLTRQPGSCKPAPPAHSCTPPTSPTPPPTPAPCPTPSVVPAGFAVHTPHGYYSNPVGDNKGTLSITACAALCASAGSGCAAFHVFFADPAHCAAGTCYVHALPLATVTADARAILYDKIRV